MLLVDLIIVFLAGMQIVEILHHGSLFAPLRAWAERRKDLETAGETLRSWIVRKFAQLLYCPFCEAPWACAIAAFGWKWGGSVAWLIIFALAASRLANLTNDLTHKWSRSPGGDSHSEEEELEISESWTE
jgi:hypothetical protein